MLRKFNDIPVTTTLEQVIKRLRIGEPEDVEMVTGLFDKAKAAARPKALYREAYVDEVGHGYAVIDGVRFESGVLSMNLKDANRVFAYVCTCGTEVDDWSKSETDYVVSLWLDMIKETFLHEAVVFLREHLKNVYKFDNLPSVNPGSGDAENWPISQQVPLFQLIGGVEAEIGVKLTDSCLMVPIKSSSGLFYPSETDFVNCALCRRANCKGRRAEFDEVLYERAFA